MPETPEYQSRFRILAIVLFALAGLLRARGLIDESFSLIAGGLGIFLALAIVQRLVKKSEPYSLEELQSKIDKLTLEGKEYGDGTWTANIIEISNEIKQLGECEMVICHFIRTPKISEGRSVLEASEVGFSKLNAKTGIQAWLTICGFAIDAHVKVGHASPLYWNIVSSSLERRGGKWLYYRVVERFLKEDKTHFSHMHVFITQNGKEAGI